MHRLFQALLILSTLYLSLLGMMIVHELGHGLAAWASGGTVAKVVLHPLEFARTDIADNPHPLLVAWGGASLRDLIYSRPPPNAEALGYFRPVPPGRDFRRVSNWKQPRISNTIGRADLAATWLFFCHAPNRRLYTFSSFFAFS